VSLYDFTIENEKITVKRNLKGLKGYKRNFAGETFLEHRKELFFRIIEPYYSAGKRYGWNPSIGLGINEQALFYAKRKKLKLCVFIGNKKDRYYEADPETWIRFARQHNSIEKHGNTRLYVIQFSPEYFRTVLVAM